MTILFFIGRRVETLLKQDEENCACVVTVGGVKSREFSTGQEVAFLCQSQRTCVCGCVFEIEFASEVAI